MKTLTTTILLLICLLASGQSDYYLALNTDTVPYSLQTQFSPQDTANKNNNVIYWSINPAQLSLLGIRYEHYFGRVAPYASVSLLKHTGGDNITNKQVRYSLGGVYRLTYRYDEIDSPIMSLGIVYHQWLSEDYVPGQINPTMAFRRVSIEYGVGGRIGRFNMSGRVDTQMEFCFDLGFNF